MSLFNWFMETAYLMLEGFKLTIELFIITIVFSIPLGLVLCFLKLSNEKAIKFSQIFKLVGGNKKVKGEIPSGSPNIVKSFFLDLLSLVVNGFITLMRGTPLLLQIFFVYYGLPYVPVIGKYLVFDRFSAGAVAFALNYAAYYAEIFRGGLLAVDKGQYEASKVLGLTNLQTKIKIVMPQMFRIALPSVSNETIILLKDTALVTAIGLTDLLKVTKDIVNRTTDIGAFAIAAIFYLVISYILTLIFKALEKKFSF
ncbi:MAG: amino acid ABC transporter permease [Lachnospirales bacterium]